MARAAGGADVCGFARAYVVGIGSHCDPLPTRNSPARTVRQQSDIRPSSNYLLKLQYFGPLGSAFIILNGVQGLFEFPNPVNEKAARTVAAVVTATSVLILATGLYWLLIPLAYGFWARVLTGPTLSPLGRLAMNHIGPRLGEKRYTPGPPKRFAQGIGAAFSTLALVLALPLGDHAAAAVVLGVLVCAAGLEAIFGLCLGCRMFALLMRAGLVPEDVCAECADIRARLGVAR